jgi:hypothetical protein
LKGNRFMNGIPSSKRGPGCRLFAISTDPAEMARHYVLSSDDLAVIRTKRRPIADGRRPKILDIHQAPRAALRR